MAVAPGSPSASHFILVSSPQNRDAYTLSLPSDAGAHCRRANRVGPPGAFSRGSGAGRLADAADAIVAYYGRFPVPHLRIQIEPSGGNGIRGGKTFGRGGGLIVVHVGSQTPGTELASDWMMTHEMVHLTFPSMADEHHWIEEGIATYVEPIGRIQAGQMDPAEMWRDLLRDMPKGQPRAGDKGLDHTHTWGRTYWGGALYCLRADVEIRRQTQNAKGLQDALRGILDAGGDIREDWELQKALETGDRTTGTHVLMNLYEEMKDKPVEVDLDSLWKQLGVKAENGKVTLVDDAPLAGVRRAITAPSTSS